MRDKKVEKEFLNLVSNFVLTSRMNYIVIRYLELDTTNVYKDIKNQIDQLSVNTYKIIILQPRILA